MKKKSLFFWFVAFVCAALIFTGCPQEADDDTEETVETWLTAESVFKLVAVEGSRARLSVKNGADFGEAKLYDVPAAPLAVLKAVYEPNAQGSTADSMEAGKTAVTYTDALSAEVLSLFQFTTGTVSGAVTIVKVEITGTALPGDNNGGYSANNLIVIDIGKPEGNSGLPVFYIPHKGLGTGDGEYAHIRLRVNSGASLVVLADNSQYISNGSGHSCDPGLFNGGCVEVMAGGKLRDGAYEGFPLGNDAVILNRYNSYLAVGPEPGSADAATTTNDTDDAYDLYYSGWLLGPAAASHRIEWDADNNADVSYLEVRPGEIATDAKLTAKKSLGLICSVWFVGDAHLTVDAASETETVFRCQKKKLRRY